MDKLDQIFVALADPTRRALLARLAKRDTGVADLAAAFPISQPAISRHLKVLERAGLIASSVDGQRRPRRINAEPLAAASDWLEQYRSIWERSYDRLDVLIDEMTFKEIDAKKGKPS